MKLSIILLLLLYYFNIQPVLSTHPSYPAEFPLNEAFISQSTSCFVDDLLTWTCPPCDKTTSSYKLLNQYSLSGIEQFIFVNQLYQDIVVAYRYSYSKEMKSETICDRGQEVLYRVSSNGDIVNPPCIVNADLYVTNFMSDILSSSSNTIETVLDLFYQRIGQVIEAYPYQRNKLIFTGYEIGGSIAQVVNSYYMVKNTVTVSYTIGGVTISGCLPEDNVKLYQFGSPKSMNYMKDIIDAVYQQSPLFNQAYLNSYWTLFNLVNYLDPIPSYPLSGSSNTHILYIQSVYYDGIERVGFCDAKTNCLSQVPPIQNFQYVLDNHYLIYNDVQFSPITSTNDEYCNFYPDQLRDYTSPGSNYFADLCDILDEGGKVEVCTSQCFAINDNALCDCTPQCSYRNSSQPNLPYECCTDICRFCTNPICVGGVIPPPPPVNTGATCSNPIILEVPTLVDDVKTVQVNINSPQAFGYTNPNCIQLLSNAASTVIWFSLTTGNINAQYNFNTLSTTTTGTKIALWRDCNINIPGEKELCISYSDNFEQLDDGSIIVSLKPNTSYLITILSDEPNILATYYLTYSIKVIALPSENKISNTMYINSYNNETQPIISFARLPGSCDQRCAENVNELSGIFCDCDPSCNIATEERCCENICDFCTYQTNNSPPNFWCSVIYDGTYKSSCGNNRCFENPPQNGCCCDFDCFTNDKHLLCLDYLDTCGQGDQRKYLSCGAISGVDRCGREIYYSETGLENNKYICGCDEKCTANTCCTDLAQSNCPNENVRPTIQRNLCSGICGNTPIDFTCSCEDDCQQRQNCCRDYCGSCRPSDPDCDINVGEISFPPKVVESQKYYALARAPLCNMANYQSWNCSSCQYYLGYELKFFYQYNGLLNVFVHYNPTIRETIVNISPTTEYSIIDTISNFVEGINADLSATDANYGNTQCPNIAKDVDIYYFSKYYTPAVAIFNAIEIGLKGFPTYFNDKFGSTITFIGDKQGGSVAHIIYDRFVMKTTIDRYLQIRQTCPTSDGNSYSSYVVDGNNDNNIIAQFFVSCEQTILDRSGEDLYDIVLGYQWNGITPTSNYQYRGASVVNPLSPISNTPFSLSGGYYHGFQTYYLDPPGSSNIIPCENYGSWCFDVPDVNKFTSFNFFAAVGIAQNTVISAFFTAVLNRTPLKYQVGNLDSFAQYMASRSNIISEGIFIGQALVYVSQELLVELGVNRAIADEFDGYKALGLISTVPLVYDKVYDFSKLIITGNIDNTFFGLGTSDVCGVDFTPSPEIDVEVIINYLLKDENVARYIYDKKVGNVNRYNTIKNLDRKYDNDIIYDKIVNSREDNRKSLSNSTTSYVYTGDSTIATIQLFSSYILNYVEILRFYSESIQPVLITGKPNISQFDKYFDFVTIGFAPYEEIQAFNCSICQYYLNLGYILINWEHYTYYDLFWFSSPIRKEVIILMSTDNYPQTIYESVCESRVSSKSTLLQSPILSACIDNTNYYENFIRYYTESTITMFPPDNFNVTYLRNDFTFQLMRNPSYSNYIYTYVGFGSASAYIYDMYLEGFINYNQVNNSIPYNSTCPQYHVQAVIFSPLGDFRVEEGTFDTFAMSDNVKVFMNPCDRLPTLGSFSSTQTPNCYEWNCPQSNLHSYYVNETQHIIDFNELSSNERNCIIDILPNNTIVHDYTVYPAHFTLGYRSPIYGFLRNGQQLYNNFNYESVVYQVPTNNVTQEICPLLQNYPYVNNSEPVIPLSITQPPLQLQQNKYYKLNLLSYGDFDQLSNRESSWWSSSDIQNYTIVEQQYTEDWVVTAYYSSSYNELVLSMMARNDTFLYGKTICNSTENVNNFDYIDTQDCELPTVPWLYNNINIQDYESYFQLFIAIQNIFRIGRESTITFTGIGLGAGLHKAFLLHLMSYNPEYLAGNEQDLPYGTCILEANELPKYQSIFYSSTRNQYYQDPYNLVNNQVVRNITMSKFFTTVYISDDANFISAYDYLDISKLLFPTTLGPLWVYYNDQPIPLLLNGNVDSLTTGESRFYNTYYGFDSPYYNQSNWRIVGSTVTYIPASLSVNNIYTIPVSNTAESCELLTNSNITEFNNTLSTPPTLVESEIYAYFSMLAYCQVSTILDGSCLNINQKGSLASIIDTYQLTGYSDDDFQNIRVLYFTSQVYKSIIYAFASTSDDSTILNLECLDNPNNAFVLLNYNIGLNCQSSEIGSFYFKSILLTYYDNWEPKALFRDLVRNDINSNPDYKLVVTGHSVGGSIAHIAFTDVQVSTLMSRSTCESNPNFQMIVFGEVPSTKNIPILVGGNVLDTTGVLSLINECDAVPYLYPNGTGYTYWILNPRTGYTYTLTPDYVLHQVTSQEILQGNYSSCPFSNGYSIESNREYIGKRSFVGYIILNPPTKESSEESEEYTLPSEEIYDNYDNYNYDDYDISNNGRTTIEDICSTVVNPVTRIDYRGPTKSQLSKYNKLMSYSYYPGHPIIQNISPVPPYINPNDVSTVLTDPQINSYMNNNQSGEVFVGYHKIVYYTSFTNKEFVISVVPVNTTTPYYQYSCVKLATVNDPSPFGLYNDSYWKDYTNNADLGSFNSIYKGYGDSTYNLLVIATQIRSIQQNIFESQILPGHGSKSDWTITFISKDTGNNAIFTFIMNYYYTSLNYENLGGIQRFKVQNSGYKYFQTLGFGYILDKWQPNTNVFFDVNYPNPSNIVGKNIFMTVSMYNDKLSRSYMVSGRESFCTDNWNACPFPPNTPPCNRCESGYIFDKWHRAILYDEEANVVEDLEYYKCNKYESFIGPDTKTLYSSDLNSCNNTFTITREYFGLPNYFYRYSQWSCTSASVCTYLPFYPGPFISYTDPNFNICQP